MNAYLRPFVSGTSIHGNPLAENRDFREIEKRISLFLSDDCRLLTYMKPIVADRHLCYYIYIYIYMYKLIYIYIYIYRERERE